MNWFRKLIARLFPCKHDVEVIRTFLDTTDNGNVKISFRNLGF